MAAKYTHLANDFIKPRAELLLQPLPEPWANSTSPSPCASLAAPCGRHATDPALQTYNFIRWPMLLSPVHSLLDHFPGPLLTPHTRDGNTDFSFCFWVALSVPLRPEIVHDRGEGNSVAKKKDEKSSASWMEATLQQFRTKRELCKMVTSCHQQYYQSEMDLASCKSNFAASDASKSRLWICLWLLWARHIASTWIQATRRSHWLVGPAIHSTTLSLRRLKSYEISCANVSRHFLNCHLLPRNAQKALKGSWWESSAAAPLLLPPLSACQGNELTILRPSFHWPGTSLRCNSLNAMKGEVHEVLK